MLHIDFAMRQVSLPQFQVVINPEGGNGEWPGVHTAASSVSLENAVFVAWKPGDPPVALLGVSDMFAALLYLALRR